MLQCVKSGVKNVVRTFDTDVLILLSAHRHFAGNFDSKIYAWFAVGKKVFMTSVNWLYTLARKSVKHFHSFIHLLVAIPFLRSSIRVNVTFGTDGRNLRI